MGTGNNGPTATNDPEMIKATSKAITDVASIFPDNLHYLIGSADIQEALGWIPNGEFWSDDETELMPPGLGGFWGEHFDDRVDYFSARYAHFLYQFRAATENDIPTLYEFIVKGLRAMTSNYTVTEDDNMKLVFGAKIPRLTI